MPWRKFLRRSLGLAIVLLLLGLFWPIRCYRYDSPRPFSGPKWYNPFDNDTLIWSRANFHIHSRTWSGLTEGQNPPTTIDSAYRALGFAYYGISDYQHVNPASPIPLYEHGWGPRKFHQLVFSPQTILWWDFPWPFTKDIYQSILAHLHETAPLIAIAHPFFNPLQTCPSEMFLYLGGYHAIEVLNRYGDSVKEWDNALSAGHYATLLANDNVHDVHNPHQITTRWTEIALPPQATPHEVLQAILQGKTVGYKNIYAVPIAAHDYPTFRRIRVVRDTLWVVASEKVDSMRVIGQGGVVRAVFRGVQEFYYPIRAEDTYLRVELYTARVVAYTSALCRGDGPSRRPIPEEDRILTWVWRIFLLAGIGGGVYLIVRR
jgi:hypothetical protein